MESSGLGFVNLGKSYLDSSRYIEAGVAAGGLRLRFEHPVDLLLAHALELMLKGCMLADDPGCDVAAYGHDLLRLYDDARSKGVVNGLILAAEKEVTDNWRLRLRGERDKLSNLTGLSGEAAQEFGIHDNDAIGEALPGLGLRSQVLWMSGRHKQSGSAFRYLDPGVYQRSRVHAFGLSDDPVRLGIGWGCDAINHGFFAYWKSRKVR